ncbi:unnamed protein product [Polarella glacialis]|uniref:RING-type domain-containing protein n=1 Tax=Polarella glacialis TaxID=89957 RepID=A0A813G7R2_POLGL|nr:unnamed protein product [Polarella glacialis]
MEFTTIFASVGGFFAVVAWLIMFRGICCRKAPPPLAERKEQLVSELIERAELIFPALSVLGGPMCVICLEVVAPGDPARALGCSHAFHAECIRAWWSRSLQESHLQVSCPTCRREFEVCSSSALLQQPQVNNMPAATTIPPQGEVEVMDVV